MEDYSEVKIPDEQSKKNPTFFSAIAVVEGIVVVGGTNIGKRQNIFYTMTQGLCLKKMIAIPTNRKITKTDAKDFVLHITGFKFRRLVFMVSLLAEEHFHLMAFVKYTPIVVAANVQVLGGSLLSPEFNNYLKGAVFDHERKKLLLPCTMKLYSYELLF